MNISISKPEYVEILLRAKNGCKIMNRCIGIAEQDFKLAHLITNAGTDHWLRYHKAEELKPGISSLTLNLIVKAANNIVKRNTPFYKTDTCVFCCSLTLGGTTGYYAVF